MKNAKRKTKFGFTLIELLVVIAIISLLSSIVLASLGTTRAKARDSKRVQDLIQLRTALEQYALDNNGLYPARVGGGNSLGNCWDCNPSSFVPTIRDSNKLDVLTSYLNPRPFDPKLSSGSDFFPVGAQAGSGYWYKVRPSRRDYKVAIVGTKETNNVPQTMVDNNFSPPSVSISVYTSGAKDWAFDTDLTGL